MARKKDLAGLAALGALGMMLSKKGDSGSNEPEREYRSDPFGAMTQDERDARPDINGRTLAEENYGNEGRRSGPVGVGKINTAPSRSRPMRDDQYNPDVKQGRIAGQGGPRGTRYSGNVAGNPGGSYDAEMPQRRLNSAEAMRQLDEQLGIRQGPTAGDGRSVTGNEFTRNLSNTLNATAGLNVPGFVGNMTQKQYNALAAARRAGEGFSPSEALAAREAVQAVKAARKPAAEKAALSELDTTGGAIGYKKGGKTKKMASGGSVKMSASRRGDGIAQRGKTRGVMR